jgi:hypothetical protein
MSAHYAMQEILAPDDAVDGYANGAGLGIN